MNSYISCIGNINHFIGYVSILYPQLYVYNDCVFLENINEDTYNNYLKLNKKISDIEKVINHRHIVDFFQQDTNFNLNQIKFVGKILKESWIIKLKYEFPNKSFSVEFYEGDSDNLTGYYLTFYQTN